MGRWYPDGPGTLGVPIAAFGEVGKPLQFPGPLVRVPAGTTVSISLRNALPGRTLRIHGLAVGPDGDQPIVLHSGEARTIRLRRATPGTYGYWTGDEHDSLRSRFESDAALVGAIVIDDPHRPRPNDRVFVIGDWDHVWTKSGDPNYGGELLTINGRSWPATEPLRYVRGETVRWRVYNASLSSHPMHLHGFPFTLDAVGDGLRTLALTTPYREVTHRVAPGETFDAHWTADRVGMWMFHCHLTVHTMPHAPLAELVAGRLRKRSLATQVHLANNDSMGGMMMAVSVVPERGEVSARVPVPRRRLALDIVQTPKPDDEKLPFEHFAYVLHDGATTTPATGTLGPLIVLNAGDPVAIAVTNHLREATTVHWHGMPVAHSVDDGGMFMGTMSPDAMRHTMVVADTQRVPAPLVAPPATGAVRDSADLTDAMAAPPVAPGETFIAHFTPPYAGTFLYHTHLDDTWQMTGGLSGPLVVLPPGEHFDPVTDHVIMITTPSEQPFGDRVRINGLLDPPAIVVHAGVPQRLRFINMTALNADLIVSLDGAPAPSWTPLAKDGLDLDSRLRTSRRAVQQLTVGETRDFTFVAQQPGHLMLDAFDGPRLGAIPIEVVP
jgi:FtsP/CotA-like multicopper oxidase with cupredoxin domain